MIGLKNFRFSRRTVIFLIPVNLVFLFFVLLYLESIPSQHTKVLSSYFKTPKTSPSFATTPPAHAGTDSKAELKPELKPQLKPELKPKVKDTLEEFGFRIQPNDVQFKYISDDPTISKEDAFAKNEKIYLAEMAKDALEPKDFNMHTIRPPPVDQIDDYDRVSATIVSLVRNQEIDSITYTIKQFEAKFNSKFQYPYTFLNNAQFSEAFKERMLSLTKAKCEFVVIPVELWDKPDWIDKERETTAMKALAKLDIPYARMALYHNMCRFYLGKFYNVPELQKYKYYWRIEPDVQFFTDMNYDPFKYLKNTGKKYGFTVNIYDIDETVETLWPETLDFLNKDDNYKYVNPKGAFQWLTYNEQLPKKAKVANGYSCCHFWSNFEIADLDFYRGEAYTKWMDHLEQTGKFYYERWGDAPVHSVAVGLFLDSEKEVHWFKDIGYVHNPYYNCPTSPFVEGCVAGKFSNFEHANDQNCMATWINQVGESLKKVW